MWVKFWASHDSVLFSGETLLLFSLSHTQRKAVYFRLTAVCVYYEFGQHQWRSGKRDSPGTKGGGHAEMEEENQRRSFFTKMTQRLAARKDDTRNQNRYELKAQISGRMAEYHCTLVYACGIECTTPITMYSLLFFFSFCKTSPFLWMPLLHLKMERRNIFFARRNRLSYL